MLWRKIISALLVVEMPTRISALPVVMEPPNIRLQRMGSIAVLGSLVYGPAHR